jgi:hypothetical protein
LVSITSIVERAVDVVDQAVLSVAALPCAPAADCRLEVEERPAGALVETGNADHH